jgi:hypothetical protein
MPASRIFLLNAACLSLLVAAMELILRSPLLVTVTANTLTQIVFFNQSLFSLPAASEHLVQRHAVGGVGSRTTINSCSAR